MLERIAGWREEAPLKYNQEDNEQIFATVCHRVDLSCDERGSFNCHGSRPAPDVDGPVLPFQKPCSLITSGGLGTMGFGFRPLSVYKSEHRKQPSFVLPGMVASR